jgi:hypothetical protein
VTWHVGIVKMSIVVCKLVTCFIFSADCTYEYSETQMYVCMNCLDEEDPYDTIQFQTALTWV